MNKTKYYLLAFILLISLSFRVFIIYFLPINQFSLEQSPLPWSLVISLGLVNLVLLFSILQKIVGYKVGLIAALLYALSPWIAYLEIAASQYIILLMIFMVFYRIIQLLNINRRYFLFGMILILIIFLYSFKQITIFSNVGLVNAVNSFRGETSQTSFSFLGKFVENRYIYLSEHVIFNILKQFTPAAYFTNQHRLLGFSFTPPIYIGMLIPFVFGLSGLIKLLTKRDILKLVMILLLLVPSMLSKDSPDLERLIIVSPVIFFIISKGLYEFISNYKKGIFRLLLFLTLFMVLVQFLTTLSDIVWREPVRLLAFLGKF